MLEFLDLKDVQDQRAEDYLLNNRISPKISRAVIQATGGAWFADDLSNLNGLAVPVSMNTAGSGSIHSGTGGNYNLIYRLLRLSEAKLNMNIRVNKNSRSGRGKYHLAIISKDELDCLPTTEVQD